MSITIESYSEKAIAVFGETKPIKDYLLQLNGKFNPSLKGQGDEKRAGWIFPKTKQADVQKILDQYTINGLSGLETSFPNRKDNSLPSVEPRTKSVLGASVSSIAESSSTLSAYKNKTKQENEFDFTKDMYLALITRIEKLETENALLKKIVSNNTIQDSKVKIARTTQLKFTEQSDTRHDLDSDEISEEESEEEKTEVVSKRLLTKKTK
jgi:hypothetical protein